MLDDVGTVDAETLVEPFGDASPVRRIMVAITFSTARRLKRGVADRRTR
ncbi:MAG: hypothetical protein R2697_13255 [Ilumatobacteraceae bacterium]